MYTSHGHQIVGTIAEGNRPPIARCGGPGLCGDCSAEAMAYLHKSAKEHTKQMNFTTFVRIPFTVEAVEITEDNLEEVAELVGTLKTKPDGTRFIKVNNKLVPNVYQVFPGFFMTKMGDNVRCYSPRVFEEQFSKVDDNVSAWIAYFNRPKAVVQEA